MAITIQDTTIAGLAAGGLPNGTVNSTTLATSAVTAAKVGYAGEVIQTVQYTNGAYTSTNAVGVVLTAVSGAITPQFSNSKILVLYSVTVGGSNNQPVFSWVTRGGVEIGLSTTAGPGRPQLGSMPNASGYSPNDTHFSHSSFTLDSPGTTSSTTYAVLVGMRKDSDQGMRLNMPWNYSTYNQTWMAPGICVMTLMEIKQ